ncbi:hypothetical protein P154DRAFT_525490 [Amniculicola lignicola CBS 123094]|uniref:Uncharacterized protein n=1 Tax=Amniculicola lignicola CBS 123094 TaxID=1392246 RepID=A0A6A5W712_9PLEO|nr:hypothetical protein P154DRAFT_525490 [Amniculicola lignicola CBS 123094]
MTRKFNVRGIPTQPVNTPSFRLFIFVFWPNSYFVTVLHCIRATIWYPSQNLLFLSRKRFTPPPMRGFDLSSFQFLAVVHPDCATC